MQIILVALVGFLVRLVNLNQSLWLDEAIETLAVKNHSFFTLLTSYVQGDFHPPLYHFILKFWTDIFGYSEISVRFPSVIFSVLTIFFVYKIGCRLANYKVGILAALFFALNPLAIYYAQEARMYSLAMLFVTAAVWALLEERWLFFCSMVLGSLYTEYLPYLMLPVYFLLAKNKKKVVVTLITSLVLLVPWSPYLFQQLHVGTSAASDAPLWGKVVGGFDIKALPLTFVKFIIGRIALDNKYVYAAVILPIVAYYSWVTVQAKKLGLFSWLLIPLVLGMVVSLVVPIYSYFRFLFVVPAFCLILALGTNKNLKLVIPILIVSVVSLSIFNLFPKFQRENWRDLVAYVGSGVVFMPSVAQSAPLTYYDSKIKVYDKNSIPVNNFQSIYLIRYVQEIFDPADSLKNYLETNNYKQVEQKNFNGVIVWKYSL